MGDGPRAGRFFALGPAVDFVLTAVGERRRDGDARMLRERLTIAAAGAPPLLAWLPAAARRLLVAQRLSGTVEAGRAQDDLVLAARVEGPRSPEHGFLLWTPLALLALAGLLMLTLTRPGRRPRASAPARC